MRINPLQLGSHVMALAIGASAGWLSVKGRDPRRGGSSAADPARIAAAIPAPADHPGGRISRDAAPAPAGSSCREAWDALQRMPKEERARLRAALLEMWIKVDLPGALEAAMQEDDAINLLHLFNGAFDGDPQLFKDGIVTEQFGLATADLRDWWIQRMAGKDPGSLLAQASDFGPIARDKLVTLCIEVAKDNPAKLWAMVDGVASLSDTSDHRKLWSATARALVPRMDGQELLDRLIELPEAAGTAMIGDALAVMFEKSNRAGARETFERLPEEVRAAAVAAVLAKPGKAVDAYLAALDEVIGTPAWAERQTELAVRLHEMSPGSSHYASMLEWAAGIPERPDTTDIYRVAVRGFVSNNPEAAREWIEAMPPGWKRENSLAAFAQSALAARNDKVGARWAFDQLTDPAFRAQAEEFFRYHGTSATRR